MAYLIDSDWLIEYLGGRAGAKELVDRLSATGFAISIITYMEVYDGILRSADPEGASRRFEAIVETYPVLPISPEIARRCAQLRETLRREGKRVRQRALDLLIAATALEFGLTVVTRNSEDYRDIPGLSLG